MHPSSDILYIMGFKVCVEFMKGGPPTSRNKALLINGALATSATFRNMKKFLADKSDVITFDLPFSGKSKSFNEESCEIVTLDDEVTIIKHIISVYKPNIIVSVSWGGAATMKLLETGEHGLKYAIIASFSFEFNETMRAYVAEANRLARAGKFAELGILMNNEVGIFLPDRMKTCNFKHLTSLNEIEYRQGCFHLEQITNIRSVEYSDIIANSKCQYYFINGDLDKHTPQENIKDICGQYDNTHFYLVPGVGHFLDLEGKESKEKTFDVLRQIFDEIRV